jgi:magnesium transporter
VAIAPPRPGPHGTTPARRSAEHGHRHAPESAGEHLVHRVPRVTADTSVAATLAGLAGCVLDAADAVYVTDAHGRLEGVVRMTALLAAPPYHAVGEIMERAPAHAAPESDQEQVALLAIRHGLSAVPVVDAAGRLLGAVPAPALLDILRREHVEDIHRLAGIRRETARAREALVDPPLRRARHRLPWLLVGLVGSMAAAGVVARFEHLLSAHVAVAFFVPAIVYLADAIGTQTESIAVRGLSVAHAPLRRLLVGELRTGLLIGAALAALAAPTVWLGVRDARLALAVGVTVLLAGAVATTVGLLFPWALSHAGRDPALGSGPVATIVQDVLSLIVYFGVVALLMR